MQKSKPMILVAQSYPNKCLCSFSYYIKVKNVDVLNKTINFALMRTYNNIIPTIFSSQ